MNMKSLIGSRLRAHVFYLLAMFMSMSAAADWGQISPEELARQSELIVVGEFLGRDSVRLADDGNALHIGVIKVESVVKGDAGRTVALLLLPPPRPSGLVASEDIHIDRGQRGLWYLKKKSDGLYVVDRPDRFVPMDAAGARIKALRGL
jgi:hypothetical protein